APRSSFSSSSHPTIYNLQSFTTASNQQQWLPSPAPPALRQQQPQQTQPSFQLPTEDFQLFEQSTPANHPRRPSAPLQPPTFNRQHFYANSAPASTIGLRRHTSSVQNRPPVPLFSSTTPGNIQQKPVSVSATMVPGNLPRAPLFASVSHSNPDNGINVAFDGAAAALDTFDWETWSGAQFTTINDPMSASIGTAMTVSPKDVFNDPLSSAPPSAAFTNLTSPSVSESPYIDDLYDTSPMFRNDETQSGDAWYPLFPSDDKAAGDSAPVDSAPALVKQPSTTPLDSPAPLIMDTYTRRKSDPKNSPSGLAHSSVSGVGKSRRRKGPLPPITVQDPSDKTAIKRARNTLAARESRARKYEHVQTLEARIAELESEKKAAVDDAEKWKNIALSYGYTPS
ncbi:hypothetical protein HDK77DRAFT_373539, partial [Phyllosticta capitalensis]